ncbi:MAG: branched-chain-amino-acid transaminase [Candidatus Methanoliparum thermophilum]|uniref:Branched-chain-amino-acid aminotransferase n=1 Tax=Methanoliparum thermophilum TaxID=2491083 RepID=A0A520KRZ5_METT2|nr:branched-chain-amino-acid transaminase [Candidatus Methanoliparum sp. LAM-1]RZN64564.1 MAG: branched-chain-amino-acid transaminase [Candidatus Methanoliparum thermophilum]
MKNLVFIDGEYYEDNDAKISVLDHGFLYGDGVFEGIRAYNGKVFKLQEHIDRLYDSAKAIILDIPLKKEEMIENILDCIRKNNLSNAYIRVIVTRGKGDLGIDPSSCKRASIVIIAEEWDALFGNLYEKGLNAVTVSIRRNSYEAMPPGIKSLNYLNNILAKIESKIKGGDEAIILDVNGNIAEGSGENIFIIKNGIIYTPKTTTNLKGITRETIIKIAEEKLGYTVKEEFFSLFELYTADEVFITGTAAEVAPIVSVDGRIIGDGRPGRITKQLIDEFKNVITDGTPIFNHR